MIKQALKLSDKFNLSKLLRFALPSIAMMIFTSIYGVVDGFFVSNFAGKTQFAAVNLLMPFLMIISTIGFMFGTGGSAIVAKEFGKGNPELANKLFSLFVYVAFLVGVILAVLGMIFIRPISSFLGASGELLENCVIYGRVILISLPFFVMQLLFQSFFVTAEKPKLGLMVTIVAGVTNMILDAVLVLSLPAEYKLVGAAIATVSAEILGGAIPLIYFFSKNSSHLRLGRTKINLKALLRACANGSSEFMSNVSMSIVSMLYNMQLLIYAGENGIAAYGTIMYVNYIFCSAFIGYSVGTAPIVSYHDGAKDHKEVRGVLKKSLFLISLGAIIMFSLGQIFASTLSGIFVGYDKELFELTVFGFKIFACNFLLMGFSIYSSGFFTALNDGVTSAIISFLRTLVFQVTCVLVLPTFFGLTGIWASVIVAEFMAVIISGIFLIAKRKKFHY